jgi:hypothetical protein
MTTKLEIKFAPVDELNSWAQPIKFAQNISRAKFADRNNPDAIISSRRFSRQRLCLPNHTLNHFAP